VDSKIIAQADPCASTRKTNPLRSPSARYPFGSAPRPGAAHERVIEVRSPSVGSIAPPRVRYRDPRRGWPRKKRCACGRAPGGDRAACCCGRGPTWRGHVLCRGAARGTRSAPPRGPAQRTTAWEPGTARALPRRAPESAAEEARFAVQRAKRRPIRLFPIEQLAATGAASAAQSRLNASHRVGSASWRQRSAPEASQRPGSKFYFYSQMPCFWSL
jgi:hypothetical protein